MPLSCKWDVSFCVFAFLALGAALLDFRLLGLPGQAVASLSPVAVVAEMGFGGVGTGSKGQISAWVEGGGDEEGPGFEGRLEGGGRGPEAPCGLGLPFGAEFC